MLPKPGFLSREHPKTGHESIIKEGTRMKISSIGVSGTVESSDILVTLEPGDGNGIEIELKSSVEKQFGKEIRKVILETLCELGVENAHVTAVDKGALDCAVRARVKTAAYRASGEENYLWGGEQR